MLQTWTVLAVLLCTWCVIANGNVLKDGRSRTAQVLENLGKDGAVVRRKRQLNRLGQFCGKIPTCVASTSPLNVCLDLGTCQDTNAECLPGFWAYSYGTCQCKRNGADIYLPNPGSNICTKFEQWTTPAPFIWGRK